MLKHGVPDFRNLYIFILFVTAFIFNRFFSKDFIYLLYLNYLFYFVSLFCRSFSSFFYPSGFYCSLYAWDTILNNFSLFLDERLSLFPFYSVYIDYRSVWMPKSLCRLKSECWIFEFVFNKWGNSRDWLTILLLSQLLSFFNSDLTTLALFDKYFSVFEWRFAFPSYSHWT